MPAPDLKTIFKLRGTIEPVLKSALTTAGISGATIYTSRSASELVTPYVSVRMEVGSVTGHYMKPPSLSYVVFDQWNVSIITDIVTNRNVTATSHEDYEAIVRYVMVDVFARVNPLLTYHAFGERPREQGTSYSVDNVNQTDSSIITFAAVLAVRSDAWPAS